MLVITRRVGEDFVLVIDGKVLATVKLIELNSRNNKQLRIGIAAPEKVKIYRSELWNKIDKGKLKSGNV